MDSVVKWQTGEPTNDGIYIVTHKDMLCPWILSRVHGCWMFKSLRIPDEDVNAWCNLCDIEPYKEKTK